MRSTSGRTIIAFNGEIYNYVELAYEYGLAGPMARNDTAVAVELIERLGIEEACSRFNGMWAMAVLDRQRGLLHFSRDRLGKKPLYYATYGRQFMAASEMHSLLMMPGMDFKPDLTTAGRFLSLSLQNVDDRSWARGISAIPAGAVRTINLSHPIPELSEPRFFWSLLKNEAMVPSPHLSEDQWLSRLRDTLEDSVAMRLRADVPVGVALSGGIDSSVICAITRAMRDGQGATFFSAVSPGQPEDESRFVDMVSRHLDIPVEKVELSNSDSADILTEVADCSRFHDGPLTSFSPLLFRRLMERARQMGITVVLTGQGADEAFCGYRKYPFFALRELIAEKRPLRAAFKALQFLTKGAIGNFRFVEAKRYLGRSERGHLGEALADFNHNLRAGTGLAARQWADIRHYSVPALCHYEDRMSMSWSREVRSPFLDYRLIELGLAMPMEMKLGQGWTKYALRKAYADTLPDAVIWRRDKKGFANPEDNWLRGAGAHALEMMGAPDAPVYAHGLIEREPYLAMLRRYLAGDDRIWFREVFAPISTNIWLETVQSGASAIEQSRAA